MDPRTPPPSPDHESASLMSATPPTDPNAQGGWKIENVSIRQADNGGFTVSCSKKRDAKPSRGDSGNGPGIGGGDYKNSDYVFADVDKMLEYVRSEFGGGQPAAPQSALPPRAVAAPPAAEAPELMGDEGGMDSLEEEE